MIDKSAEAADDPNYLLTLADIQAWENEHGPLPPGGWLFLRTGWDARAHDQDAFLNGGETPGPGRRGRPLAGRTSPDRRLRRARPSAPTRASRTRSTRPSRSTTSCSARASTASRSSRTSRSCRRTGAIVVVAPLKLVDGTGSPSRVFALV